MSPAVLACHRAFAMASVGWRSPKARLSRLRKSEIVMQRLSVLQADKLWTEITYFFFATFVIFVFAWLYGDMHCQMD